MLHQLMSCLPAHLQGSKCVVSGAQNQPNSAEVAPAQLLQHHIPTKLELLSNLHWMIAT